MPETADDPPASSCNRLYPRPRFQEFQSLEPDPFLPRAREACGRFAKGSSGNPRGRPRGIHNPRRRVPDLAARQLGAPALSDLIDRKPHLMRLLASNSCRHRSLPSTRQRFSGSICRRCGRSRIFDRCWPPFWQPLRAATSPPPRPRISQSGWMAGCARRGASPAALKAQIATTTQPRALNLAATSARSERSRTVKLSPRI